MLKKLIAASAVLAFFACSSDEGDDGKTQPSSSSVGTGSSSSAEASSSSEEPGPQQSKILIASFNSRPSAVFNTYGYGYTLKAGKKEDLTLFWAIDDPECPIDKQTTTPPEKCELDKTDAILQNKLTNRDADLHYKVDGIGIFPNYAIELTSYNLTEEGDQAALGLNAGEGANEGKSIGELGNHKIDGTIAFTYKHLGGAHTFRAAANDDDFWYKEVPASLDTVEVEIFVNDLAGMGSFAGNEEEGTEATFFELLRVAKFLWAVEYNPAGQNQGTLSIDDFNAIVEK
jgi:hypothetical protein